MIDIECEHNLTADELIKALTGIIVLEDIEEPLIKALKQNKSEREEIPEKYMRELNAHFVYEGKAIDRLVGDNVDLILGDMVSIPLRKAKRTTSSMISDMIGKTPSRAKGLRLSQDQIEELVRIIRSHYRIRLAFGPKWSWDIDKAMEQRWRNLGVIAPGTRLTGLIDDAFIAGRLSAILDDGYSMAEMRKMANEFPVPRESSLALQAVQERVGFDLSGGLGYRAERIGGELVLGYNTQRMHDIIGAYRRGELKSTKTNRGNLAPEEMQVLESEKTVTGWRQLGRELRNRMASEDRNRDWERVAASALRMTHSVGAVSAMAEEGVEYLYYHVQKGACHSCKKLYLESNGDPKKFPVEKILTTIIDTGGANYGRSAALIGHETQGWLPNALAHPWCQCRPRRWLEDSTGKQLR